MTTSVLLTQFPDPAKRVFRSIDESGIIQALLEQEERLSEERLAGKKRSALFDLDNTLLIGDIGDAVFARLRQEGEPLSLTWKEYRRLCEEDPMLAYIEVVRSLSGLSVARLRDATVSVLQSPYDYILCEGDRVKVPKANYIMREVVRLLRYWHYSLFIVSASNDVSAKVAGSMLFNIPASTIAGIKLKESNHLLTNTIVGPIPVGKGKISTYRMLGGDATPLIVATDSILDLPMLSLCDPDGMAIIVGNDDALYSKTKAELPQTVRFHRIPNSSLLTFQE